MSHDPLTHAGRHLLSRRDFLRWGGTGLGGIALTTLLAEQGLLAAEDGSPIRPVIDPAQPNAPRTPHFAPKAKRVLVIFCSGALSHVDTFDLQTGAGEAARHADAGHRTSSSPSRARTATSSSRSGIFDRAGRAEK